jgi:MoxR-like ATPase
VGVRGGSRPRRASGARADAIEPRLEQERDGRAQVDEIDLWLAPYVVCAHPQAVPAVQAWFDARIVQAVPQPLPWLGAAVAAFEQQLEIEASMPADDDAAGGASGKLALARAIGRTDLVGGGDAAGGTGLLRIRAAALEQRTRRHYSSVHIAARLAQLDEVLAAVDAAREPLADELALLQARIAGRLWLPPELVQRWTGAHRDTLALLDAMAARLSAARDGFAALPRDELSEESAAPAVAWG